MTENAGRLIAYYEDNGFCMTRWRHRQGSEGDHFIVGYAPTASGARVDVMPVATPDGRPVLPRPVEICAFMRDFEHVGMEFSGRPLLLSAE